MSDGDFSPRPPEPGRPATSGESSPALVDERPPTRPGTLVVAWAALGLALAWFWLPVLFRWHTVELPLALAGLACLVVAFATSSRGSVGRKVAVAATVVVVVEGLVVVAGLIVAGMIAAAWTDG
jgi:hypothetical protein